MRISKANDGVIEKRATYKVANAYTFWWTHHRKGMDILFWMKKKEKDGKLKMESDGIQPLSIP